MKEEDKIFEKFGRNPGFKIPDGYFDQVFNETMKNLPPREASPAPQVNRTVWQRVQPYLYMAAMFAGIWMMMKVFYHVSPVSELNIENPPEHIAMAMQDNDFSDPLLMIPSLSDYELEREMSEQYTDIADFERDFGYELEDEFADLEVE